MDLWLAHAKHFKSSTFLFQAAEQAKASPALVAKDPTTTVNKKEEEDLAKGKYKVSVFEVQRDILAHMLS